MASLATTLLVSAQQAATNSSEEIVQLSKFEVTTTQGHGYVATNAASGFKTNETLLNIPQIDTVITRDLINDIGYADSSNVTQYFGLSNFYAGEAFAARGYRINYAYVDQIPSNQPYEDNCWVDTYEIIKGPAQVLYLNASLSGTVLKTAKKPLPFAQNVATVSVDSWGLVRATVDSTAPLGTLGDAKLGYRFVAAYQGGGSYFTNYKDQRQIVFPTFEVDFKNTTARIYYIYENLKHPPAGENLITPSGDLYTGAGRDVSNYPPSMMEIHQSNRFFGSVDTRVSDNWEHRFEVGAWTLKRYGGIGYLVNEDWGDKQMTYNARLNNLRYSYWAILDDIQGNYNVGPFKNSDAFGGGWDEYTVKQSTWSAASFAGFTNPVVSMNDAAAINAVHVPQWNEYNGMLVSPTGNYGLHNQTVVSSIYWQHTIDVVPNYVTLVAGWTWSDITTEGTANVSTLPWTTITTPSQQYLHRYGIIVKPVKDVSVYAMQSTTFNPPSQGALLQNLTLPPAQQGKGQEVGVKTAFFGGRLSSDLAWFKMTTSNVLSVGGTLPNGYSYWVPVGSTVQEGVDGDLAFAIVQGWQVIGSFYAGHDRDQLGKPVSNSYDNSWSLYTRYDFQKETALRGLGFGAGFVRVGGRWISKSGITNAVWTDFQTWSGEIKLKTGSLLNAFAVYQLNKHWTARVSCANVLDKTYVLGEQTVLYADPAPPRTFSFEIDYKF